MYRSFLIALALISPSLFVAANGNAHACPSGSILTPVKEHHGKHHGPDYECKCVSHGSHIKPFKDGCSAELHWTGRFPQCVPHCHPKPPKPSHKSGKWSKRSTGQLALLPDGSPSHCDVNDIACPIPSLSNKDRVEYECAKPMEDIDNCGGCASTGDGESCADMPGVRGTSCIRGACHIHSCQRGHVLRTTSAGKKYCKKTFISI